MYATNLPTAGRARSKPTQPRGECRHAWWVVSLFHVVVRLHIGSFFTHRALLVGYDWSLGRAPAANQNVDEGEHQLPEEQTGPVPPAPRLCAGRQAGFPAERERHLPQPTSCATSLPTPAPAASWRRLHDMYERARARHLP